MCLQQGGGLMANLIRRLTLSSALGALAILSLSACTTSGDGNGKTERLAPCPDSPNCVSTLSTDDEHRIEPIEFEGSAQAAKEQLLAIVRSMPRTRIVDDDGLYVHAEFRSRVFRFVDDVEFYIDADAGLVQFRSASRKGYSDLGVNRRRMEEIRDAFVAATPRI
jgi:uncharacterized protein (DUF1499 family)